MAHTSLIWLDITPCSIVIVCNECELWRGLALNVDDAWDRARDHEQKCHPESRQVEWAIDKRARRAVRA